MYASMHVCAHVHIYITHTRAHMYTHHTAAADCLARGAKILEEYDLETAMHLLYDALDIYESETRDANAAEVFRCVYQHPCIYCMSIMCCV